MTLLPIAMILGAVPSLETFEAPGYGAPVSGVWYGAGEAASALPLGGLGTGFVELKSDGRFGATTVDNNWLHPQPVGGATGFVIRAGEKSVDLTAGAAAAELPLRFWGHFPAGDVDFGDALGPVRLRLRALSPLVPHDYDASGMPVALFRFTATNAGLEAVPVELALQWEGGSQGSVAVGRVPGWENGSRGIPSGVVGSVAGKTLAPGETAEVTFGLAWYFPEWTSSDDEKLRHRYAARYKDAGEVLADALRRADEIERKIVAWQEKVYAADVPAALKDACLNGLYVLARNSWWIDDGRFFQSESFTGCPITETFVCRFYGSFPLALMWPELEKATMREVAKHQGENGQIPFGFGTPMGTRTPMMDLQVPIVSTEFALTTWRNFELWKDDAYLAEAWPAVKKALQFAMTLDTDGDGLVNEAPGNEQGFPANQYYDIWPWWGTSAYVGGISLTAWRAGEEMARLRGDGAFADELRGRYERGRKAYDEKLWTGEYYRLYSGNEKHPASDTSLANALCGQWYAYASGLGEVLPKERIASAIDTVFRLNVAASPYGAVNGVKPDGSRDESFKDHSAVLTIGELWCFNAMAAFGGHRKDEAVRLFEKSYENIALRHRTPWNIPWSLDPDTGAIKWGIHYYSNPCVWTLFEALAPEAYRALGGRG